MATMALVQAQVDSDVTQRATEVLKRDGITVEEAVRMLLQKTADDGVLPFVSGAPGDDCTPQEYDVWFRAQVQEALDDPRPGIPHEEVEIRWAKRRAELLERARLNDAA